MNVFFLDMDPVLAASYMATDHLTKMPIECAQMLSTAHDEVGLWRQGMCKPCFANHPSTQWVRSTDSNYQWTLKHMIALLKERDKRGLALHEVWNRVGYLYQSPCYIRRGPLTPPNLAMPGYYKGLAGDFEDCIFSYRWYYYQDKILGKGMGYVGTTEPEWLLHLKGKL